MLVESRRQCVGAVWSFSTILVPDHQTQALWLGNKCLTSGPSHPSFFCKLPTNGPSVWVLTLLSNEIQSLEKGLFLTIGSLRVLGKVLRSSWESFWLWENITERKIISALRWVMRSAEICHSVLIFLMCLSVGLWYILWQDITLESVYNRWDRLCGISYLSELGCFDFKVTPWRQFMSHSYLHDLFSPPEVGGVHWQ